MRLEFSPNALRGLRHLPARDAAQLVAKINRFATDPFGRWPWAKGFGDGRGRIRQGDWRALYQIHQDTITVEIVEVEHRRDAYR